MFVSFRITLNRFLRHLALIRCRNLQEARSLATSGGKHGIQCDGHVRFAERWCGPSLNGGPWTRHGNMMKYGNNSSSLTKPPSFVYRQKNFTVDWFILGCWPLWGHSKKSVAVMADTTNPCSAPSWMFKLMKSQTAILQISTEFQWSQKWEVQIEISQFQNTRRVCRFVFHISSRLITSNTWPVPTLMDG